MTIPPLREPETSWIIAIHHDDFYNNWSVKDGDGVFVSAKGYPTTRSPADFRSLADAESFLAQNLVVLERRCANRPGFRGFAIHESRSLWPISYDEPVRLGR
jgi:hypothetical protein